MPRQLLHSSRSATAGARFPVSARGLLADLAAVLLLLLAPLLILLKHHTYPIFTPEVGLNAVIALILGVILVGAMRIAGAIGRVVTLAVLLTLFIDIHLNVEPRPAIVVAVVFAVAVALIGSLLWLVREHAATIVAVAFLTLVIATVAIPAGNEQSTIQVRTQAAGPKTALPLYLHLILDEHIAPDHLPEEIPGARQLKGDLHTFYVTHGFRLHSRAYSQYGHTYNAIGNLMNFAASRLDRAHVGPSAVSGEWVLRRSSYLTGLLQKGYRLHIYQSSFMDLCHAADLVVAHCLTYPVTSIRAMRDINLAHVEKAQFLAYAVIHNSQVMALANKVYERLARKTLSRFGIDLPQWRWFEPRVGPLLVPQVLQRLRADIQANPRGRAFIVHLLMPHYPYVFDEACRLRPRISQWLTNRIQSAEPLVYNTPESRAERYPLYFEQVRCTMRWIDELLQELDRAGLLADASIVIHGDHGSRIPLYFPDAQTHAAALPTESDYADVFSSLFAVRAPGVEPGVSATPAPLSELLRHYFDGSSPSSKSMCSVFLSNDASGDALVEVNPGFCKDTSRTSQVRGDPDEAP